MSVPHQYIRKPDVVAPVRPWITILILVLCLFMFYQFSSRDMLWLKWSAFAPAKFTLFYSQGKYLQLLGAMFWPTFCQASIWQLIGNAYFLWVFGSLVEVRLGFVRYLCLVLLGIFGGWTMLSYEVGLKSYALFIGPAILTCTLIGAYMVFFPEKKISPGGTIGRSTRFFRNERDPDPSESFGVSPWVILTAFVAYQILMHFLLAAMPVHLDNIRVTPAIVAFLAGLVTSAAMVTIVTGGASTNPLRSMVVQRYQQLRALDLTHDEAIEGASRLMSVPSEQVKQWVSKGGGPLPQTPQT